MWQRMFNICSNYVENFFRVCLKSFQKLSNFCSKSAQNITNLSLISVENPINLPKCRRRITCKFRGFCSTNHAVITNELFFDDKRYILDEEVTCDRMVRARALLGVGREDCITTNSVPLSDSFSRTTQRRATIFFSRCKLSRDASPTTAP